MEGLPRKILLTAQPMTSTISPAYRISHGRRNKAQSPAAASTISAPKLILSACISFLHSPLTVIFRLFTFFLNHIFVRVFISKSALFVLATILNSQSSIFIFIFFTKPQANEVKIVNLFSLQLDSLDINLDFNAYSDSDWIEHQSQRELFLSFYIPLFLQYHF